LQEYKLRGDKLRDLEQQLWKEATFLGYEASPAYNHTVMEVGTGSESVGIFIAPHICHLIHLSRSILQNQAQWIMLKYYLGGGFW
jgi:hypothetical protein